MGRRMIAYWQPILVVVLFAASLTVLLVNSFIALLLPQHELEARDHLRTAAIALAQSAQPLLSEVPADATIGRTLPDTLHRQLAAETADVLRKYPGLEGGFYVNGRA